MSNTNLEQADNIKKGAWGYRQIISRFIYRNLLLLQEDFPQTVEQPNCSQNIYIMRIVKFFIAIFAFCILFPSCSKEENLNVAKQIESNEFLINYGLNESNPVLDPHYLTPQEV